MVANFNFKQLSIGFAGWLAQWSDSSAQVKMNSFNFNVHTSLIEQF